MEICGYGLTDREGRLLRGMPALSTWSLRQGSPRRSQSHHAGRQGNRSPYSCPRESRGRRTQAESTSVTFIFVTLSSDSSGSFVPPT